MLDIRNFHNMLKYMEVSMTRRLGPNKDVTINYPNLTDRYMVPHRVTFTEIGKESEKNAQEIVAVIKVGASNLISRREPYFQLNNVIELNDIMNSINEGTDFSVCLTNKDNEPTARTFKITVEYRKSYGDIIFENSYNDYDNVMSEIKKSGRCTKLILTFNRPIKNAQLINTAEYEILETEKQDDEHEHDWFESLELGDTIDNSYVLDLTDSGMEIYSNFLDFMKLIIPNNNTRSGATEHAGQTAVDDDNDNDLMLYVMAYGYK